MAFLSLARGDVAARNLLQRAIRARYGVRPIALETLRLWLTTDSKGPLGLPVKTAVTASYMGIQHSRWDQTRKLFGLTLSQTTDSITDSVYLKQQAKKVTRIDDPVTLQSVRRRLWGVLALWLIPLTGAEVTIAAVDKHILQAMPSAEPNDVVTITLNPDDTIAMVTVERYRARDKRNVKYLIKPVGDLRTLNNLTVPEQIVFAWQDGQPDVFTIVNAEANPTIAPNEFSL